MTTNVLFLCTGNSARSIMAEVILNDLGGDRFSAFSAGSQPSGEINPCAERQLNKHGHELASLTSKSWDVFAGYGAPDFDIVITVCDNAAGESCPIWYGNPARAHWGVKDPATADGDDQQIDAAFDKAYERLHRHIEGLVGLPVDDLPKDELAAKLREISLATSERS